MQDYEDAGMKLLELMGVDTDKSAREHKKKTQGKVQRTLLASQLFSAMAPLEAVKVLLSIMKSVSFSKKRKPLKLRHYDITRAHFQGTAQRLLYVRLPVEDRQKYGEDKVGRLIKSMYGTRDASHMWQLDYVTLICGELGGFRRGKHNAALFHNSNEDVRMAVCGEWVMSPPRESPETGMGWRRRPTVHCGVSTPVHRECGGVQVVDSEGSARIQWRCNTLSEPCSHLLDRAIGTHAKRARRDHLQRKAQITARDTKHSGWKRRTIWAWK